MHKLALAAAAALTLSLAACGNDHDGWPAAPTAEDDTPACAEVFAPGRATAEVLTQLDAGAACLETDGDVFLTAVVSFNCADGTRANIVDTYGWGRDGDVWQGGDVPAPTMGAC